MVEVEEREQLLHSLRAYLEELRESGVDELCFAEPPLSTPSRSDVTKAPRQDAAAPREDSGTPRQGADAAPCQESEALRQPAAAASPGQDAEDPCQGVGNPQARLLFVMSGAGFAGEAGEMLANIIKAMKFASTDVFLLTYPAGSPGAGTPSRQQLLRRIQAVGPEVVVTLGEQLAQTLLQTGEPVAKLRGRFHDLGGMALMPTLHPEAMLADQSLKREVWSEMQQVMRRLSQSR